MRYNYEAPAFYLAQYGKTYICDHPVYNSCTLYTKGDIGLAVIQQRHDDEKKISWWSEIDPWLVDAIYLHDGFYAYFNEYAREPTDGLYPTVNIRQIMWRLRMKPIKRHPSDTAFDKCPI